MNLNKFKFAIYIFIGILTTSILLGCFIMTQNFSTMEMGHEGKSSECCGSGTSNFINHLGPDIQYTLATNNILLIVISFVSALFIFINIKSNIFANYYLIKDRCGGFKLFYKFILLFKTGTLHPKLY